MTVTLHRWISAIACCLLFILPLIDAQSCAKAGLNHPNTSRIDKQLLNKALTLNNPLFGFIEKDLTLSRGNGLVPKWEFFSALKKSYSTKHSALQNRLIWIMVHSEMTTDLYEYSRSTKEHKFFRTLILKHELIERMVRTDQLSTEDFIYQMAAQRDMKSLQAVDLWIQTKQRENLGLIEAAFVHAIAKNHPEAAQRLEFFQLDPHQLMLKLTTHYIRIKSQLTCFRSFTPDERVHLLAEQSNINAFIQTYSHHNKYQFDPSAALVSYLEQNQGTILGRSDLDAIQFLFDAGAELNSDHILALRNANDSSSFSNFLESLKILNRLYPSQLLKPLRDLIHLNSPEAPHLLNAMSLDAETVQKHFDDLLTDEDPSAAAFIYQNAQIDPQWIKDFKLRIYYEARDHEQKGIGPASRKLYHLNQATGEIPFDYY